MGTMPWKWSMVRYIEMPNPRSDSTKAVIGSQRGTSGTEAYSASAESSSTSWSVSERTSVMGAPPVSSI